jgi:hypothetical protein
MNQNQKEKPQPVNKEAFKMLAMEIGLNAASRKLGVPIPTGKSWAQRGGWKLPKRNGGGKPLELVASGPHPVADALATSHKELEDGTKTALMQTLHKAAQAVARKAPLDISNMGQFRDACLSAARMFGWDGQPSVNYYGDDNRTVVVCSAERRRELIQQRQRLLEAESQGKVIEVNGHETETAAPVALPAQETQSNASVDAGKGTVAQDQSPAVQPDPVFQHMESIGKAESWKTGKGSELENHAGMFGPYPEEYE